MKAAWTAVFLACLAGPAEAHEIRFEEARQQAAVVRLTYPDGQPFAFEAYELYLPGKNTPQQVGRTDAGGRLVFLAGEHPRWRLKAFSADGHGLDQILTVAPDSTPAARADEAPRWALALAGVGTLFGLFGLVQLFLRKKST